MKKTEMDTNMNKIVDLVVTNYSELKINFIQIWLNTKFQITLISGEKKNN
jgi:hypothetical protein